MVFTGTGWQLAQTHDTRRVPDPKPDGSDTAGHAVQYAVAFAVYQIDERLLFGVAGIVFYETFASAWCK